MDIDEIYLRRTCLSSAIKKEEKEDESTIDHREEESLEKYGRKLGRRSLKILRDGIDNWVKETRPKDPDK